MWKGSSRERWMEKEQKKKERSCTNQRGYTQDCARRILEVYQCQNHRNISKTLFPSGASSFTCQITRRRVIFRCAVFSRSASSHRPATADRARTHVFTVILNRATKKEANVTRPPLLTLCTTLITRSLKATPPEPSSRGLSIRDWIWQYWWQLMNNACHLTALIEVTTIKFTIFK